MSPSLNKWFQEADRLLLSFEDFHYAVGDIRRMNFPGLRDQAHSALICATTNEDREVAEARFYQAFMMTLMAHEMEAHASIAGDRFDASYVLKALVALCSEVCNVEPAANTLFGLSWGSRDEFDSVKDLLDLFAILKKNVKQDCHELDQGIYPVMCRGVLLVYLMGRWACWQAYQKKLPANKDQSVAANKDQSVGHVGHEIALSWKEDVQPIVNGYLQEGNTLNAPSVCCLFPKDSTFAAGLAMLQFDIFENDGRVQWSPQPGKRESIVFHDISLDDIADNYLTSDAIALLKCCTGLTRDQLLFRFRDENVAPVLGPIIFPPSSKLPWDSCDVDVELPNFAFVEGDMDLDDKCRIPEFDVRLIASQSHKALKNWVSKTKKNKKNIRLNQISSAGPGTDTDPALANLPKWKCSQCSTFWKQAMSSCRCCGTRRDATAIAPAQQHTSHRPTVTASLIGTGASNNQGFSFGLQPATASTATPLAIDNDERSLESLGTLSSKSATQIFVVRMPSAISSKEPVLNTVCEDAVYEQPGDEIDSDRIIANEEEEVSEEFSMAIAASLPANSPYQATTAMKKRNKLGRKKNRLCGNG